METPNVNMPGYYPGTAKGQNLALIIIIVVVLAIIGFVIYKTVGGISGFFKMFGDGADSVLEGLGIKDTAQEKENKDIIQAAKEQSSTVASPWNSTYYQSSPKGSLLLYEADAQKIANQIYDSVGNVWDNSDEGLAAFKTLKTKTQVSYLCEAFNKLYSADLFAWLEYHYDTGKQISNLRAIIDYVNSLPPYKIG